MAVQSLGNPQISGRTVDELRVSTQFWLQQVFNHLDRVTGLRGNPKLFSSLDVGGNSIINVAAGSNPTDVIVKSQALTLQTTPTGTVFNANTTPIVNAAPAVQPTDVPTLNQVVTLITTTISTTTSGLTFTALAVGFSIKGGVAPKTLTVDLNLTASTSISVAGTANRISTSGSTSLSVGGTISTIDIAATYVGQASITTLGTISTGTWQGSVIAGQYGGTGVANTGETITLGGNLTTTGAFASTFTVTGAFTYTFPGGTSTLLANNFGITGGTTLIGDTAASGNLTFQSTSNATRGAVLFQIGQSTGFAGLVGIIDVQTSSAGIGNTADTNDDTLFTYTLPINALNTNGKSLRGIANGHFATNGNNKRVKFFFAGTAIADSGVVTSNNVDWTCTFELARIDSTHVSAVGVFTANGVASVVTVTPNLVVADLTANTSIVKITGASPTTGAANDVLGYQMRTRFEQLT